MLMVVCASMATLLFDYTSSRSFAHQLSKDFGEYKSTFGLSFPFVVKHSVQFSPATQSDYVYLVFGSYRSLVREVLVVSEPRG